MGCSHIHVLVVGIVGILMLLVAFLVFHLKIVEGEGLACEEIGDADVDHTDA